MNPNYTSGQQPDFNSSPSQENPQPFNYGGGSVPSKNKKNRSERLKSISSTILLIISAPLLAIFITSHVFHSYEVDGASMETTLQSGDRLIVYKLPKTLANVRKTDFTPNRYDIIVFDRPKSAAAPSSVKHLIKRVIGLPGERVTVKDGVVTVYNKENPEGFNPDSGQEYSSGFDTTPRNADVTVGEAEVFVLGDNRGNSTDSRDLGTIPDSLIVGKATIRFVPVDNMKRL